MIDNFNEIVKFSPFGGELILEEVKGTTSGNLNPENNVDTKLGADRSMFSYIPKSGCPHAKQGQVLMVLRDDNSKDSAIKLMHELELDKLAEERHFILLFPNPLENGWNYLKDEHYDNDEAFLVRCFASLPKSKGKVSGFNGMIFFIGTSKSSNALISQLAVDSPLDVAAFMVGKYPDDYVLKAFKAEQVAFVNEENKDLIDALSVANGSYDLKEEDNLRIYTNKHNKAVKHFVSKESLSSELVRKAWNIMFSETRRWRNDTYGTYQERIDFNKKGFVKHFEDSSLNVNNNFKHTWYEYVPESVRNSNEKVPLVFYFHGINCIGLYGAEQSGFDKIADEEKMIVVFPDPAIEERWNVWDDPRLPSDVDYIMALIKHMKEVHPIDESRIYISGFSMGSMFTNTLASAYPDVFAGALAFNGPHMGYFATLDSSRQGMAMFRPNTIINTLPLSDSTKSPIHELADQKKNKYDYRMPFVQFVGLLDNVGFDFKRLWPVLNNDDGLWPKTISYWKKYNNADPENIYDANYKTGIVSNKVTTKGRFIHQSWLDNDKENDCLYHLFSVERMPHAVDLEGVKMGFDIIKQYQRDPSGALIKM